MKSQDELVREFFEQEIRTRFMNMINKFLIKNTELLLDKKIDPLTLLPIFKEIVCNQIDKMQDLTNKVDNGVQKMILDAIIDNDSSTIN